MHLALALLTAPAVEFSSSEATNSIGWVLPIQKLFTKSISIIEMHNALQHSLERLCESLAYLIFSTSIDKPSPSLSVGMHGN